MLFLIVIIFHKISLLVINDQTIATLVSTRDFFQNIKNLPNQSFEQ